MKEVIMSKPLRVVYNLYGNMLWKLGLFSYFDDLLKRKRFQWFRHKVVSDYCWPRKDEVWRELEITSDTIDEAMSDMLDHLAHVKYKEQGRPYPYDFIVQVGNDGPLSALAKKLYGS